MCRVVTSGAQTGTVPMESVAQSADGNWGGLKLPPSD